MFQYIYELIKEFQWLESQIEYFQLAPISSRARACEFVSRSKKCRGQSNTLCKNFYCMQRRKCRANNLLQTNLNNEMSRINLILEDHPEYYPVDAAFKFCSLSYESIIENLNTLQTQKEDLDSKMLREPRRCVNEWNYFLTFQRNWTWKTKEYLDLEKRVKSILVEQFALLEELMNRLSFQYEFQSEASLLEDDFYYSSDYDDYTKNISTRFFI